MTERNIRYSQIAKFRRCRRSWLLEYVQGLELDREAGTTKGARDLGTLVHKLAETYYSNEDWREQLSTEREILREDGHWSEEWGAHFELAQIMFEGYVQWLGNEGADASEKVLHVEPQLRMYFGNYHGDEVYLTGKPDLIKQNTITGVVFIDDTKTVQSLEDVQHHAPQGLTYAILAKDNFGLDVGAFRTNQLKKVKRTARAKPPFYSRPEMLITPEHLKNHHEQLEGQLDSMVEFVQQFEREGYSDRKAHNKIFYPNQAGTCSWDCDFLPVCKQMDNGSNFEHIIRSFYRRKSETTPQESNV
jgi:hypothetical protein